MSKECSPCSQRFVWSGGEDRGQELVGLKGQNSGRRGQGGRGLTEEVQGGFLEEVAFELGLVSWGKIAHRWSWGESWSREGRR